MGRRKREIKAIKDDRNRSATFLMRKGGLFKKAHELSVLCSVDIAVFVFGNNKRLYEYSSTDMRDLMSRYQYHDGQKEHKGPGDYSDRYYDDGGDDDAFISPPYPRPEPEPLLVQEVANRPRPTIQIAQTGLEQGSGTVGSLSSPPPACNISQPLLHGSTAEATRSPSSLAPVPETSPVETPPPPLPSRSLNMEFLPDLDTSYYYDLLQSGSSVRGISQISSADGFSASVSAAATAAASGSREIPETMKRIRSEALERPSQNKRIRVAELRELRPLQDDHTTTQIARHPASVVPLSSSTPASPTFLAREVNSSDPTPVLGVNPSSVAAPAAGRRDVAERLAYLLFRSSKTRLLYGEASAKLSREDFHKEHDDILKHYLLDLVRQANQEPASLAVWALKSKTQRRLVTELVWGKAASNEQLVAEGKASINADEEDDEVSSDGEFDQAVDWYKCVNLDADFFLKGQPFADLEIRLEHIARLPAGIAEVLEHGDLNKLTIYLESHFEQACTGEYAWIDDLRDIDYSRAEIAQLLYERKHDSPWIFFEPTSGPSEFEVKLDHHLSGCVHTLPQPPLSDSRITQSPSLDSDKLSEVTQTLEAMCGLGGIIPHSRNRRKWPGVVAFEQLNTLAELRYKLGKDDTGSILSISGRLLKAIGSLQHLGFCCNSLTVLSIRQLESAHESAVHMASISVSLPQMLHESLKAVDGHSQDSDRENHLSTVQKTARDIINTALGTNVDLDGLNKLREEEREDAIHHTCALAIQILTVGLLSYAQAHIGPLQPFFLDTPLRQISLLGTARLPSMEGFSGPFSPYVTARLVNLSCLGAMCRGPVLAFQAVTEPSAQLTDDGAMYDVRAKPEDILDTWGPGELVFDSKHPESPLAIRIGGGFISPPSTDEGTGKYHWDTVPRISKSSSPVNLKEEILVGSLVTVNESCKNNEKACWEASSCRFEELGTYRSYSEVTEHQIGLKGGLLDQFSLQTNKVWGKRRGRTIKARNLECAKDNMLITFLQFYWGVRVSFCTGVSQRVKLTQLVADVLPAFVKALTSRQERIWWADLESNHNIIARFRHSARQPLCDWLAALPDDVNKFIIGLVRQILMTLEDTGLSPTGEEFLVAWPYDGIVNRCFRIPLDEHNKWTVMLADSDDCATFAYATNTCLEAGDTHRCRGPDPEWRDRISLLETAVLCPASKMPSAQWSLAAEQTYFFHKLDNNLFWVKARVIPAGVRGVRTAALVRLVSRQSIPLDVRQRLLFNEERRRQRRLREKDLASVPAKIVTVLASTTG